MKNGIFLKLRVSEIRVMQGAKVHIYSEKAIKFCEISTVDLTVTTEDKSTVENSQTFVAFSEYMNFSS